jgi:two-component system sensor histidine kinase AlgZ
LDTALGGAPGAAPAAERERTAEQLDLCRTTMALRVVLFVQLAWATGALLSSAGPREALAVIDRSAFGALAATLLWLAVVCALRRRLAPLAPARRGAVAGAAGALAALAAMGLLAALGAAQAQPWPALGAVVAGLLLALAVWTWIELRARAARPADDSARLAELQSRIRPHFLFNALNSAITLVQVDPQRAESMLEDLAELFRAALAETGASVSLAEEVEIARRYLAIEQLRFGKRLQVHWDLDPAAAAARVPPLVLQPLVENAVRHGVEPQQAGGQVLVRTQARRGMVRVLVSNSVGSAPSRPGAGMALANVRERMRLLHDVGGSLDTWRDGGQHHARLTLPL